ncbi:MAG: hypothetical protein V9G04_08900 [Nocardioides sp.]|jgi:hypothetical protein
MHPGCDCSVAPILGDIDPGEVLNADLLEQMHYEVGDKFGDANRAGRAVAMPDGKVVDYQDILIRDHGELGPLLTWRKHSTVGPGGKLLPAEDTPIFNVPPAPMWPTDITPISPERWSYILYGTSKGKGGHSKLAPHYPTIPGNKRSHTYFANWLPDEVMRAIAYVATKPEVDVVDGPNDRIIIGNYRKKRIRLVVSRDEGGQWYIFNSYPIA